MQRISQLILKKIAGHITPVEEEELAVWAKESEANSQLYRKLTDPSALKRELDLWNMIDSERRCSEMQRHVNAILWRSRLRRLSVAAAVAIGVIGLGALLTGRRDMNPDDTREIAAATTPVTPDDIRPGTTCAVLSDASGHNVALNAADTSRVASTLLEVSTADNEVRELCLDVPRGGEFKVQLEDGSEVWLNSSSRLYYPEKFSNEMRRVHIEGEAYLVVTPDSLRPFYVESGNQLIRVYGTAFNVRSYPEDSEIYTTLEKGRVSISRSDNNCSELMLTPGHQAVFAMADSKVRVREVNTEVVTSWRNGRFVFENRSLLSIMQDLSRWYDFDYEFSDPSLESEEFMGSIPRYSDFTTAISILEKCGGIRFSIAGGKVLINRINS